jgi:hypothetical protein
MCVGLATCPRDEVGRVVRPPRETNLSEGVLNHVELGVRVGADGLNRRQADDDNQGEHDRVLDCSRTVFRNQKPLHAVQNLAHR